jgi:Tol biopolymer transport system component
MDMNGLNPRNVVQLSLLNGIGAITEPAPFPSWSPDGKWLVYHRCSKPECALIDDYDIYKVEIATGIEYKIIEHGVFPDWKKTSP